MATEEPPESPKPPESSEPPESPSGEADGGTDSDDAGIPGDADLLFFYPPEPGHTMVYEGSTDFSGGSIPFTIDVEIVDVATEAGDTIVSALERTTFEHPQTSYTDEAVADFVTRADGSLLIPVSRLAGVPVEGEVHVEIPSIPHLEDVGIVNRSVSYVAAFDDGTTASYDLSYWVSGGFLPNGDYGVLYESTTEVTDDDGVQVQKTSVTYQFIPGVGMWQEKVTLPTGETSTITASQW